MLSFLRMHYAISKQQHAFLLRRSTCTNLIETINDWTLAIKSKKSVVDYTRAFDTVSQKKLINKLAAYGIQEHCSRGLKVERSKRELGRHCRVLFTSSMVWSRAASWDHYWFCNMPAR
jgi:hypothetical protein